MTEVIESRNPGHLHPGYTTAPRPLRVSSITPLTDRIMHVRFESVDGAPLTPHQPGSHLIVHAGPHRNAYSLVDDGMDCRTYGISVLHRGEGGGSDWLHENVSRGDVVTVEGPRAMFAPILEQKSALLVAGDIGVTPILSHARAIARGAGRAEVIYAYRPGAGAHLEDLRALAERSAITLYEANDAETTRRLLRERFADQPLGSHAYACGPAPLLDTYQQVAADCGWPPARVHLERFTAPELDPGEPFTVQIATDGARIDVPAGVSLLQTLLDHGIPVPNLCRQGVCGECRIPVRAGSITHRDFVLTDQEKAIGDSMLCCVSRGSDIEVGL